MNRQPAGSRAEYVYLIGCEESNVVKIGRTRDLKVRLGAIQRMSPVRVKVLWHTEGNAALESSLHKAFRFRRSYGEWFNFAGLDPVEVVQSAIRGDWQEDLPDGYAHALSPITPRTGEARRGTATQLRMRLLGGGPIWY